MANTVLKAVGVDRQCGKHCVLKAVGVDSLSIWDKMLDPPEQCLSLTHP